ncbi:mono and diacylglycerol lipase precursor [Penicillium chermesinum]|uniref:Mono and diacylglycerol lipase n=1 Tax=Penicillium chermesinum TaxID=63820 RepID=A0A9W9PIG7_9EURO|nr:mono and diacylglycerol lipase precursor [Penicillium chermesinum]KAJ5246253.1 mono and diacylglycerol lipase precursor [Penicillium chermesinum]KAJ6144540.1 mono and diacylglycerol lipase precursor [Penicillium chermesinum]
MYSIITGVLFAVTAIGSAIPSSLRTRDIPAGELTQFKFWVQYAAAAYCEVNYAGQAGSELKCAVGNCPQVEASGATILYDFSNSTLTDTSGFVARDDTNKAIILSIRGSYSVRNWISDVEFPYTDPGLCEGCEAEFGFWNSWDVVREPVTQIIHEAVAAHPDYELFVVGHSLGAAVATLAAADLRIHGHLEATLYAFAAPRVANLALAKVITAQGKNYRFTHTKDPVPKLPLLSMGYVHVSPEYWITSGNNVTVTTADVKVLDGEVNFDGNTGTGFPSLSDFDDHHWYFEKADACIPPGTPWRV